MYMDMTNRTKSATFSLGDDVYCESESEYVRVVHFNLGKVSSGSVRRLVLLTALQWVTTRKESK